MTSLFEFAPRGSGLRPVMGASLCARLPIGMASVSLPLFVLDRGLGPLASAAAVAAFGLGQAIGSPFWGRQIDQRPLRELVPVGTLAFAVLCLIFVLVPSSSFGYAGIAVALGLCALPFSAAMRSFWLRQDLGDGQGSAARFESWLSEAVLLGGRVAVSALLLVVSSAAIFGVESALALMGGTAFATARLVRADRPVEQAIAIRRARDVLVHGRRYATYLLLSASLGAYSFALIVMLSDRSGSWAAGGVAVWGLGSLVGVAAAPKRLGSVRGALLTMGGAQILVLATHNPLIALPAAFLAGLPIAVIVTKLFDQLAAATAPARRGEVFAWAGTFLFVGNSLGTGACGLWAEVAKTNTFVLVAVAFAGAAAITAR